MMNPTDRNLVSDGNREPKLLSTRSRKGERRDFSASGHSYTIRGRGTSVVHATSASLNAPERPHRSADLDW